MSAVLFFPMRLMDEHEKTCSLSFVCSVDTLVLRRLSALQNMNHAILQ